MKLRNIFLIVIILSLPLSAFLIWREIFVSFPGEERTVTLPSGSSFNQTSYILKKNGVIPSRPLFRLFAEAKRATHQIQAGEYRLNTGMSWNILLT
jgi:cell division protein YceG involved in septum cleavage